MRRLQFTAGSAEDGMRLDKALRNKLGVSMASIRRAKYVPDGITVDGKRSRTSHVLAAGECVSIIVDDAAWEDKLPCIVVQYRDLDVVYQDQDIIVINKPADMVCYPGPGHNQDTLANYLMGYLRDRNMSCCVHAVNRLDASTTGLIVFALNSHAHYVLQQQLHSGDFKRTYWALCFGVPELHEGRICAPIGMLQTRAEGPRNVYGICDNGKFAATRYKVLNTFEVEDIGLCSLVELELETGRTHQIRIHMASIGCGLLGDEVYGHPCKAISRAALHSYRALVVHPVTGERLDLHANLPKDMTEVFQAFSLPIAPL